MKKLIYGFILLFCIALNGCKKDDLIFKKEQLLGQWTFIKELKKVNNDAEVEIPITSLTISKVQVMLI
jgi:hypothetical protein